VPLLLPLKIKELLRKFSVLEFLNKRSKNRKLLELGLEFASL